ncbi:acyltransferase family protein [Paraconexibacter algicola]|uniref:Acyltransferase 3 domain-containing protein n=1 Tax=Paraconexibacter algicola TaxID=2133960 RepID=A0A2T4UEG1_9ACTN|nr:acyltransferase [Paraconexibacter algicola]PTL56092.1 hypothetical protein C7Y72_13925 [Paraconexibacter algicola]
MSGATPDVVRPAARDAALDGLRGIAAGSVLVYHAWLYKAGTDPMSSRRAGFVDGALHELRLGLVLFFVVSGFLLFSPWVRAALEGRPAPRLRAYAIRRVGRIVPAYYLAILGSIVLLWPHDGSPGVRLPPAEDLWLFAVFGQNLQSSTLLKLDPPMWTLAVEATFYAVLPLLGWLALRRLTGLSPRAVLLAVCGLFFAVGVAFNAWLVANPDLDAYVLSKQLPAFATYFALGMAVAVLAHGRTVGPRARAVLLLAGSAAVVIGAWWAADFGRLDDRRQWRDTGAAAGFALVLLATWCAASRARLLAWAPLSALGRLSYGVYLWHVPLMVWLRSVGLLPSSTLGATVVALLPTLLVAAASWRWVELPAQRLARAASAR